MTRSRISSSLISPIFSSASAIQSFGVGAFTPLTASKTAPIRLLLRIVERGALVLPPSNDTASGKRPSLRRDHRALSLTVSAVVVEHYPVARLSQFVRPPRVGEESCVTPFATLC